MAERRTRRSFTREFKAQAVKRLLDSGKGLSEVATELGIGTGQLSQWRTEHLAAGSAEALAVRKAEQAETQRLKREVKRLEEEVEIAGDYDLAFVGILNDDTTDVGRVHLGAVYVLDAHDTNVTVRETEKMTGRWAEVAELRALREDMESWSQIVFDSLLNS